MSFSTVALWPVAESKLGLREQTGCMWSKDMLAEQPDPRHVNFNSLAEGSHIKQPEGSQCTISSISIRLDVARLCRPWKARLPATVSCGSL